MPAGPRFRHTPAAEKQARQRRRFPYTAQVFVVYGLATPVVAAGVALLFKSLGYGYLLVERQLEKPLPDAPSWRNLLFGAGTPEIALAGGLIGLLLWRRLWAGDDPDPVADMFRGALLGMVHGLLIIPVGLFGLYLRTGPSGVPVLVQPFFGILVAFLGSFYVLMFPWIWGTALFMGGIMGAVSALCADYLKTRLPE